MRKSIFINNLFTSHILHTFSLFFPVSSTSKNTFRSASVFSVFLLLMLCMLCTAHVQAQLTGRVSDAHSGAPLAFVHIVVQDTNMGTMTDIDGNFTLELPDTAAFIQLSYVGYFTKIQPIDHTVDVMEITLYPRPYQLQEVVVMAGENPAHRIIRNAMDQRRANDPENLSSFFYTSYNKFLATLDQDFYMERWEMTRDSINKRMVDVLDERHVFILESVTERKFRAPDLSNEVVVANRVSGLENPMFTMLATELQPFTFYQNHITLLGKQYISPLNQAAFSRYDYQLEDSFLHDTDTVYVVAYQPRPDTNFDGLKGLLYINSRSWAIQNVIAEPASQAMAGLKFRIQQMYRLIDGAYWFPVQLNTDIDFFNSRASNPTAMVPIRMLGRSYIRHIEINPTLRRSAFSSYAVDFEPDANRKSLYYWNQYRADTLTEKEVNTYHFMDSLGKANNFDRLLNSFDPLAFGQLPLGMLSLPLHRVYRYNEFEGHRPGIGLVTNNRFSKRLSLGGYYAWGSRDKKEKYGYFGEVVVYPYRDIRLGGSYEFDISERGGNHFKQQTFFLSTLLVRNLYMDKMDYTRKTSAYVSFLAWRNFVQAEISANRGETFWTDLYYFVPGNERPGIRSYDFADVTLRLRFAYGEKLINTPVRAIRLPSAYPVVYFNYTKGFDNIAGSDISYTRLEARAEINYTIALWGKQSWIVEAGLTNRDNLPWSLLFTAKAGNRQFYLASPFSFGTMDMNEFAANRYASVFFQHNFESLLFRRPGYAPEVLLIGNAGFGKLQSPQHHIFMNARSWHKGFFESGIAINKLFPQRWVSKVIFGMSPGIEVLYRMGPYSLPEAKDNVTVKLSMVLAL